MAPVIALMFALAAATPPAPPSDMPPVPRTGRWISAFSGTNRTGAIETGTLRRNGDTVQVWGRWVNTSGPQQGETDYDLTEYHCTNRTQTLIAYVVERDGQPVQQAVIPPAQRRAEPIAEHSVGAVVRHLACDD